VKAAFTSESRHVRRERRERRYVDQSWLTPLMLCMIG
jgi:hypothetical protein